MSTMLSPPFLARRTVSREAVHAGGEFAHRVHMWIRADSAKRKPTAIGDTQASEGATVSDKE